ncbi:TPA: hypothetical protein ACH3X1_016592 [Trebouxia sp. C0004]
MLCPRYQSGHVLFGQHVVLAGEPGMSPLKLEAEVNTALNLAYRQGHAKSQDPAESELSYDEPTPEEDAYSRANSRQSRESLRSTRSSDDGELSTADGETSSVSKADKRQRFADRRKNHYNMRNSLQKGKELVTELYQTNTVDEQQNGHDCHRQQYQHGVDDEH